MKNGGDDKERRGRRQSGGDDSMTPPSLQMRDGGAVFSFSFSVLLATPHRREQLLAGWIHTPALTTMTMTMVSLSLSSAPVLDGAHNCGSSQIQELLVTMGDGGSTRTCLTHGLRVWVGTGTGTGTLKSSRGLPMPLPIHNRAVAK